MSSTSSKLLLTAAVLVATVATTQAQELSPRPDLPCTPDPWATKMWTTTRYWLCNANIDVRHYIEEKAKFDAGRAKLLREGKTIYPWAEEEEEEAQGAKLASFLHKINPRKDKKQQNKMLEEEEEEEQGLADLLHKINPRKDKFAGSLKAFKKAQMLEEEEWEVHAGISGQGGRPSWNIDVSHSWDEQQHPSRPTLLNRRRQHINK